MTQGVKKSLDGERIELTPERVAELKAARERCGLGVPALFRRLTDVPCGLSVGTVNNWLATNPKTSTMRKDHFQFVIDAFDELAKEIGGKLTITDEMRTQLLAEAERTGIRQHTLLKRQPDRPDGLAVHTVGFWMHGTVTSARADHWHYVLKKYSALPDAPR